MAAARPVAPKCDPVGRWTLQLDWKAARPSDDQPAATSFTIAKARDRYQLQADPNLKTLKKSVQVSDQQGACNVVIEHQVDPDGDVAGSASPEPRVDRYRYELRELNGQVRGTVSFEQTQDQSDQAPDNKTKIVTTSTANFTVTGTKTGSVERGISTSSPAAH